MRRIIGKAAIVGSGTMGSGIAALLASVGIPCLLLDIVASEVTDEEKAKGLTLKDREVRDRIARTNKERFILKAKPEPITDIDNADLIAVGNIEDDLGELSSCDWIVEAAPERLEIKRGILKTIAPYVKEGAIVSTNTSGISVNKIAEGMPRKFRAAWFGTHFFNPVRFMRLLEIVPCSDTSPELVEFMTEFGSKVLGKGIVVCKDTPNFIANRVGAALGTNVIKLMVEKGMTVSEADELTGTCIGRPKTATFALYDLVGLDIGVASATVVHDNVTNVDEKRNLTFPGFVYSMLEKNMLGNKTKGGFYKKVKDQRLMVDTKTLEYVPMKAADFSSLAEAQKRKGLAERLECLFNSDDEAGKFVWEHMKRYFVDTASKLPEICEDISSVDKAIRWGYNHDCGPFEVWQGLELRKYVDRMAEEGEAIPAWVKEMLSLGFESFYKEEAGRLFCYSLIAKRYTPVEEPRGAIVLKRAQAERKVIRESPATTLYDIGDGVLCLELHTKTTAIDEALLEGFAAAQDELREGWDGMVIASGAKNFCVGADLNLVRGCIAGKEWDKIDSLLKLSQGIYMRNKYSPKPVVIAAQGLVLGGGCEIMMHGSAIQAAGESYVGLVELGVGLVPAGGGVKEMTLRALERTKGTTAFLVDFLAPYALNIATAKVSGSAREAQKMGYLRPCDDITMNPELLISDAKKKVLALIDKSYTPPVKRAFPAPGINDNAAIALQAKVMKDSGLISDYDLHLINQLVFIMTGGGLSKGVLIDEDYLLRLEREVFIDLCKEPKTQERIDAMLSTGKALRN